MNPDLQKKVDAMKWQKRHQVQCTFLYASAAFTLIGAFLPGYNPVWLAGVTTWLISISLGVFWILPNWKKAMTFRSNDENLN